MTGREGFFTPVLHFSNTPTSSRFCSSFFLVADFPAEKLSNLRFREHVAELNILGYLVGNELLAAPIDQIDRTVTRDDLNIRFRKVVGLYPPPDFSSGAPATNEPCITKSKQKNRLIDFNFQRKL